MLQRTEPREHVNFGSRKRKDEPVREAERRCIPGTLQRRHLQRHPVGREQICQHFLELTSEFIFVKIVSVP